MNTCMLAYAQRRFLVFANKTTLAVAGACGHVSAYGLLGGCAHALLSMWVHAYFFSAICNERWALISFGDICGSACHCICGYTLTIPPTHTLPNYPRTKHPPCPFSQLKIIVGGLPRGIMGARRRNLRLARDAPNLSAFVLTATCTMRRQDLTPGLAPSQHPCIQPHFTPTSFPPKPLHPMAISVLAINSLSRACRWASPQCMLRIKRPSSFTQPIPLRPAHTQPPHALAKYTKEPWL